MDTYQLGLVESREILEKCGKVAVIDHHRKGVGFIEKADLVCHEPYASSASELVTEFLQYVGDRDDKPNRIEAELLSGVAITDEASLRAAADALLATGLHRVFISLGGDGVFAADRSGERVHLPVLPAEMVNTTGCGDAFMAAITWAYLAGTDLTGTAKAGLAASAIAMEGAETINPAMSAEALKLRAGL